MALTSDEIAQVNAHAKERLAAPDLFELLTASVNGGKTPDPSIDFDKLLREAADEVRSGTKIAQVIRACSYDLLFADVEFDMRVFEQKHMRMALNCWANGGNVDWNAIMPAVVQRAAEGVLRERIEEEVAWGEK